MEHNTNKILDLPNDGKTFISKSINVNINAYLGIVTSEIIRLFKQASQSIVPSLINTSLYLLIFGSVIGTRLGDANSYTLFLIPGLIMMNVINGSYMFVGFIVFMLKFLRSKEEILIAPMSLHSFILGMITGGMIRSLVVSAAMLLIFYIWTDFHIEHPLLALVIILLTAITFGLVGILVALYATGFDHINLLQSFVLTPLTYLSGVFYSIDMLGVVFKILSYFNPLVYLIDSLRFAFLGYSGIHWWLSLLALIVFNIFLYIITYRRTAIKIKS